MEVIFLRILQFLTIAFVNHKILLSQHRRLSYSRHAVNENDLGTEPQPQVNYRQQMNFKRMVSERALKSGKTRRTGNIDNDGTYMNGRISYGENGEGKKTINPSFMTSVMLKPYPIL